MSIALEDHLRGVSSPANLRINDQVRAFREACRQRGCNRPYHHFAFGQSPFPPPPEVIDALARWPGHHSWRKRIPRTPEEEDAFLRVHYPLIVDGVGISGGT